MDLRASYALKLKFALKRTSKCNKLMQPLIIILCKHQKTRIFLAFALVRLVPSKEYRRLNKAKDKIIVNLDDNERGQRGARATTTQQLKVSERISRTSSGDLSQSPRSRRSLDSKIFSVARKTSSQWQVVQQFGIEFTSLLRILAPDVALHVLRMVKNAVSRKQFHAQGWGFQPTAPNQRLYINISPPPQPNSQTSGLGGRGGIRKLSTNVKKYFENFLHKLTSQFFIRSRYDQMS